MTARRLHRWLSVVASVFVLYVAATGVMIGFDSVWASAYMSLHGMTISAHGEPSPRLAKMLANDGTLADADLLPMLDVATRALRSISPNDPPPRVIRLRMYGNMQQGVIVTGGTEATQVVINARSGSPAGLYEPGYPRSPLPFQQGVHELWKQMHRGDIFGLTGRWIDLVTGFAILFLTVSGIAMYWQAHSARSKLKRRGIFWR